MSDRNYKQLFASRTVKILIYIFRISWTVLSNPKLSLNKGELAVIVAVITCDCINTDLTAAQRKIWNISLLESYSITKQTCHIHRVYKHYHPSPWLTNIHLLVKLQVRGRLKVIKVTSSEKQLNIFSRKSDWTTSVVSPLVSQSVR